MRLSGRDTTLFDLLEAQAHASHRAAQALYTLVTDCGPAEDPGDLGIEVSGSTGKWVIDQSRLKEHWSVIKQIEHDADDVIRQVFNRVDATFITPLDKEDLQVLSTKLDDVTDGIEAAASRFVLFHIEEMREDMPALAEVVVRSTEAICKAIGGLRDLRNKETVAQALERIHQIESEGDHQFRQALANLFDMPFGQPLIVIKWKDIYERVEKTIDRCEQIAAVVEGILVKYA